MRHLGTVVWCATLCLLWWCAGIASGVLFVVSRPVGFWFSLDDEQIVTPHPRASFPNVLLSAWCVDMHFWKSWNTASMGFEPQTSFVCLQRTKHWATQSSVLKARSSVLVYIGSTPDTEIKSISTTISKTTSILTGPPKPRKSIIKTSQFWPTRGQFRPTHKNKS